MMKLSVARRALGVAVAVLVGSVFLPSSVFAQGDALQLDEWGTMFSGSGVVDWKNMTGFQTGDEPPMITIYANAEGASPWSEGEPFTQGIAYSNDRGRTWTKYEGNPVQGHLNDGNRDPKVIWWEETNGGRIYMPCTLRPEDDAQGISLFARGDTAEATTLEVWELEPIWR